MAMELEWAQIIVQETAKAGISELAKFGMEKLRDFLEEGKQPDPADQWIPIGTRIFEGPTFEQVHDDTEEVPPLLEQHALMTSRTRQTKLDRGYFETRVNGKFHEYWAVGLPWIPQTDFTRTTPQQLTIPRELQGAINHRAAILYYSRIADGGKPYLRASEKAGRLLE